MLSNQEMFDRAWNGLKSQGFTRAFEDGKCKYAVRGVDGDIVKRCAWGWVDPEGTESCDDGTVLDLSNDGIGLAAGLYKVPDLGTSRHPLSFARALQQAHDGADDSASTSDMLGMEARLRRVADEFGLTVPE